MSGDIQLSIIYKKMSYKIISLFKYKKLGLKNEFSRIKLVSKRIRL